MKIITFLVAIIFIACTSFAQIDLPPGAGNPRATISEEVGITSITIKYSRPDVNKREGKIWGDGNLVTNGFTTQSFITNKNTAPWRAGANENTTITFEHDVKVEGQPIKAGTYGLFMAMGADNVTLIFSKQSEAWGSFYYDEKHDALRVNVKPVALDKSVEYLKYEFIEHKEKYCVIAMQWEKLSVPFKVDVDVDNIVVARLREEMTSRKSFMPAIELMAAQYCLNKNINLEEALAWSKMAINGNGGQKTYITLRNLATAYEKLNRLPEADSTMNEALTIATANQYTAYGRILITQKRLDKAMEVFAASQKRYGDMFGVNNGWMSGYSAKGDFKNALKYAEKALAQAPSEASKTIVQGQIAKLKEGKDIN
jgi:predicted negative regulator of RcsB-dependent stress response